MRLRVCLPLALASMLAVAGCSKSPQVVSAADFNRWQSTSNALVKFIPSDTPGYAITTRNYTLLTGSGSKVHQPMIMLFKDLAYQTLTKLDESAARRNDPKVNAFMSLYTDFIHVVFDYQEYAADWGLDPQGRIDRVIYINNIFPVFKMTTVDDAKLEKKLATLWDNMSNVDEFMKLTADNGSTWYMLDMNELMCASEFSDFFDCGDEDNVIALPDVLAVNVNQGVFTMTLASRNIEVIGKDDDGNDIIDHVFNEEELNANLSLPKDSLSPKILSQFDDRYESIGMLNWAALYENAIQKLITPDLRSMLLRTRSGKEALACIDEPFAQLKEVPQIYVNSLIERNGSLHIESDLVITSPKMRNLLSELDSVTISTSTPDTIAEINLNIDLYKFDDVYNLIADTIKNSNLKCEHLADAWEEILDSGSGIYNDDLDKNVLQGVSFSLNNIDFEFEDLSKFSFALGINGSIVDSLGALLMFVMDEPPQTNVVSTIDLSEVSDQPFILNVLKTDHPSLYMSTSDIDLNQLQSIPLKKSGNLFEMNISHKFMNLMNSDAIMKLENQALDLDPEEDFIEYQLAIIASEMYKLFEYDYEYRVFANDKGIHADFFVIDAKK